jgi:glutaredoxin 2
MENEYYSSVVASRKEILESNEYKNSFVGKLLDSLESSNVNYNIDEQGVITVSSLTEDEKLKSNIDTSSLQSNTDKVETNTSDGLLNQLKNNTESTNSRIDIQNDLMSAQLALTHEQNQTIAEHVNAVNQQNKILSTLTDGVNALVKLKVEENLINGAISANKDILIASKVDYEINGDENIRNSNGDKIIPIHEKAKKDSEKAIETSNMNNTDLTKVLDIFDDVDENSNDLSDDNNLFSILENVFTLPSDYEIPENLKEKDL